MKDKLENVKPFYAHRLPDKPLDEWQTLEEHLENVAEAAGDFADAFGAAEWGRCAGFMHDAGKATLAFQRRLKGSTERVDHSTYGAHLSQKKRIGQRSGIQTFRSGESREERQNQTGPSV